MSARLERAYSAALRLYPSAFRNSYARLMEQAFRDALCDPEYPRQKLLRQTAMDLFTSVAKEHSIMLRETYARPALVFNALVLAGMSTVLALAIFAISQQVLRTQANDPQIQLATDAAARLESGAAVQEPLPSAPVNMARSLSPFLLVYDEQGKPVSGQAQLDGVVPAPPRGVFDFARQHGEDRITWKPVAGIRIAAVIERVGGPHPGFVLAGRSLREVEARTKQIWGIASLAWVLMLTLIAVGTALLGWMTRPARPELRASAIPQG